jgi:hypothetical protein
MREVVQLVGVCVTVNVVLVQSNIQSCYDNHIMTMTCTSC